MKTITGSSDTYQDQNDYEAQQRGMGGIWLKGVPK